tara:strand:- start:2087 stop:2272 length:186 start_codon:yes stop_codon:yes gene_type:complete
MNSQNKDILSYISQIPTAHTSLVKRLTVFSKPRKTIRRGPIGGRRTIKRKSSRKKPKKSKK